jgi:ATP-binding cassette subfamily F protein 3
MVLRTTGLEVGYGQEEGVKGRRDEGEMRNTFSPLPVHPSTSSGQTPVTRSLFTSDDLYLTWKDRAALIGPNGAGKTSFIRTALGQIPPLKGSAELGSSLRLAYFAQAHEELNNERTVIEELKENNPARMSDGEARYYLAQFLFRNDDVFKPVGGLSGGEKARLALAILQLKGANFLVLDEPTNHLDILSQEVLQSQLAQFAGTILLVSHDRYLIDALATQIWEVISGDSKLHVFQGGYSEYRASKQLTLDSAQQKAHFSKFAAVKKPKDTVSKDQQRRLRQQMEKLEDDIALLETHLKALEVELENPPADPGKVQRLGQEYASVQAVLEERVEEWSKLGEENSIS